MIFFCVCVCVIRKESYYVIKLFLKLKKNLYKGIIILWNFEDN